MASTSISINITTIAQIATMVDDKLSIMNYVMWRDQTQALIESIQMFNHKTKGFQQPKAVLTTQGGKEEFNPTYMTWKQEDRLIKSLIIDLDTTLEVWKCL